MNADVYKRLAKALDLLPGGYPPTTLEKNPHQTRIAVTIPI